jgi:septum formation protein
VERRSAIWQIVIGELRYFPIRNWQFAFCNLQFAFFCDSMDADTSQPVLALASQSPRRRELLAEAGYRFTVVPPRGDVECGVCSETGPAGLVAELAFRKARDVREQLLGKTTDFVILAADTVAECDGLILGKPRDEADARTMLQQLSGREHRVLTGVCLWPAAIAHRFDEGRDHKSRPLVRVAVTRLRMDRLSDRQLDEYLASGQWEGKAGAFGYQDGLGWVHVVEGSESNVVGLPMELLAQMLQELSKTR